ncbi:hypothetical protein pdam_00023668, partial [Pocillopora damicornis]
MENVKVVILWLYENYQTKFFAEVQRQNLTGRVWILSEAHLTSTLPLKDILESSLGFQLHEFSDSGFKEYLKDVLVRERDNRSFLEWNDSTSEIWKLLRSKKCVHHQIQQCSKDLIKEIYSSVIPYTIDAVYALAHAIDISSRDFTSSNTGTLDKSPIANSLGMQKLLQRVSFDGLTGKIKFDQFGDRGSAHYDIFSFKEGPVGDIKSIEKVLAMIFAIERIINNTSLLSNISLGYDIRDHSGNLSKAVKLVYKLLTVDSCVNLSQNALRKK